jgi:RsiW-degrading membrane proteinase PrsW (M82 family)
MTNRQPIFRKTWFLVFISGLVLFIISNLAYSYTKNFAFVPVVLLIGAFLIPITFVVYIYQRVPRGEIPLRPVLVAFFWGGGLGVAIAGFLEYVTLRQMGTIQLVGVGFIEESAKLIIPVVIFLSGKYRHEADGLLFGVATGMGFAALETIGYGFSSFLQNQGGINALDQTLIFRGLLSPTGHAAWTAIVCSALWRQREKAGRSVINWMVIGAFVLAILLHASWDIFGNISQTIGAQWVVLDYVSLFVIGGISLWVLIWRIRTAHHITTLKIADEKSQSDSLKNIT